MGPKANSTLANRPSARWSRVVFVIWLPMCAVVVSFTMAGHLLTLPAPTSPLTQFLTQGTGWRAFHVVARSCGCSQRVLAELFERGPMRGIDERILLIGDDEATAKRAQTAGFAFEQVTSAGLEARYGILGAPLLVVVSDHNRLIYSGGYSRTKGGPLQDSQVLSAALGGAAPEPLPNFGCATSRSLQKKLDPLSLKYRAD